MSRVHIEQVWQDYQRDMDKWLILFCFLARQVFRFFFSFSFHNSIIFCVHNTFLIVFLVLPEETEWFSLLYCISYIEISHCYFHSSLCVFASEYLRTYVCVCDCVCLRECMHVFSLLFLYGGGGGRRRGDLTYDLRASFKINFSRTYSFILSCKTKIINAWEWWNSIFMEFLLSVYEPSFRILFV